MGRKFGRARAGAAKTTRRGWIGIGVGWCPFLVEKGTKGGEATSDYDEASFKDGVVGY